MLPQQRVSPLPSASGCSWKTVLSLADQAGIAVKTSLSRRVIVNMGMGSLSPMMACSAFTAAACGMETGKIAMDTAKRAAMTARVRRKTECLQSNGAFVSRQHGRDKPWVRALTSEAAKRRAITERCDLEATFSRTTGSGSFVRQRRGLPPAAGGALAPMPATWYSISMGPAFSKISVPFTDSPSFNGRCRSTSMP